MMRSTRERGRPIDNDICGVLSKAKGQSAHLATILHVADHCIKSASTQLHETNRLPLEVEDSMSRSTVLMNHLINVKYILCPPATSEESTDLNPLALWKMKEMWKMRKFVK